MFEINDKEIIFTERNRNILLAGFRLHPGYSFHQLQDFL